MSDPEILKTKKDALVAALTQLSNAAQDASRACIDFYAAASIPGAPPLFSVPPAAAALLPAAQISSSSDESPVLAGAKKRGPKKTIVVETVASAEPDEDEAEMETSGKKPKRKRIIDPAAPRRPQTVYFAFANEARKLIREEYQAKGIEATNTEIIREVAERWKNMSDEQKEPWKAIYAEQIKRYDEEKAAYNAGKGMEKEKETATKVEEPLEKKKRGRKKKTSIAPEEAEEEAVGSAAEEPPSTPAVALPTPVQTQPELVATPLESPSKAVRKRKHKHEGAVAATEGAAATPSQPTAEAGAPTPKEKRKRKKKSEVALPASDS
ncbi:hypothetical protein V1508DRAFT_420166 [Lipomyces doorenjongii]|uniref:uncharacterized protein n=1 Tax=Lipomyces doorenjongii TaxID=383834 RepID=UPI0034CEEA91